MDQLIFASLSHTHYWYEVGMLKVIRQRQTKRLGRYNFASFVTYHLWRAKARTRLLQAILFLVLLVSFGQTTACRSCSDQFRHDTCRPLFCPLAPSPLVQGHSHSLVGVGTKSSEVVQEIPLPLFFLHPPTARAPHQFSEHHALR